MKKVLISLIMLLFFALTFNRGYAEDKIKITFLELGSVGCIPCKKMQPIMKSIEKKYGDQIKVIFHDVRKDKAKIDEFKIKLIPTQVFLDDKGKEIHRHEGYYPEADIDMFLKSKGLKEKR